MAPAIRILLAPVSVYDLRQSRDYWGETAATGAVKCLSRVSRQLPHGSALRGVAQPQRPTAACCNEGSKVILSARKKARKMAMFFGGLGALPLLTRAAAAGHRTPTRGGGPAASTAAAAGRNTECHIAIAGAPGSCCSSSETLPPPVYVHLRQASRATAPALASLLLGTPLGTLNSRESLSRCLPRKQLQQKLQKQQQHQQQQVAAAADFSWLLSRRQLRGS